MPNDFQAAIADMIDANTTMVDALAKVAALTSLPAETVKQIVNGEGGAPDEVAAVAAALKVKPGGTRTKAKKTEPMAGGKSVTVTVEGFAEHTTKPFTIFTADPEPGPRKYTRDQLQVIAENFNGGIKRRFNEDLKNPLVIGHEEDQQILKRSDLPAAGWVDKVWVDGDRLMGQATRVPDPVRSWIDSGLYRTWSAEIYRDYKGAGPALRRVALLGADIPHKKDLGELAWENNHEEPSFDTFTGVTAMADEITDLEVTKHMDMPQAPQADDGEEIEIKGKMKKSQAAAAPAPAAPAAAPQPMRPAMPQRFAEEDMAEIKELKEMLAIERQRRVEIESAQRKAEITKFAEDKAKEGLWTGDTTTTIINGLLKLDGVDKFDEGESATDVAMRLLASVAPKQQRTSAPLSALADTRNEDEVTELKRLKQDFAEYCKFGGTLSLEKYAEHNGFEIPESN
jgi:hypothetical protein